ncbi:MAG: hypothetical protein HYY17_15515 [Planctomycetes bacterium]|nr:hypothetical protein [Planctomycetota bacterium]
MPYDEEVESAEELGDEGGDAGAAEFVPEAAAKARPDVYTFLLAFAFLAFLVGTIVAAKELYQNYDVQFWILSKK